MVLAGTFLDRKFGKVFLDHNFYWRLPRNGAATNHHLACLS